MPRYMNAVNINVQNVGVSQNAELVLKLAAMTRVILFALIILLHMGPIDF